MTPLQAMKQALEALNKYAYYDTNKGYRCVACNTLHINSHLEWCPMLIAERNLRTAIEEMEKAEPVAWLYTYAGKPHAAGLKPRESWADHEQHPLYTHPAPIQGEVVVTTDEDGRCVAVTRQDEEGRILSVIWEAKEPT